jgi:hypothetical protein
MTPSDGSNRFRTVPGTAPRGLVPGSHPLRGEPEPRQEARGQLGWRNPEPTRRTQPDRARGRRKP